MSWCLWSGCIIEYVGRMACMAGYRKERIRAAEYLQWLLDQRTGDVKVDEPQERDVRTPGTPTPCT